MLMAATEWIASLARSAYLHPANPGLKMYVVKRPLEIVKP